MLRGLLPFQGQLVRGGSGTGLGLSRGDVGPGPGPGWRSQCQGSHQGDVWHVVGSCVLQDPLEAIGKLVENVRCGSESKWEYTGIIVMLLPVNAQEEPVSRADWTQLESVANINFCQVCPRAYCHNM